MKKKKKTSQKRAGSYASKESNSKDLSVLAFPTHLSENKIISELQETVAKLKAFDTLGKTLTSSLDLNEILRLVVEKVGFLVGSKHLGLVLLQNSGSEFYFQYPVIPTPQRKLHSLGRGLIGKSLERGKGELIRQPQAHDDFDPEIDGVILRDIGSMITLPIISRGRVMGALILVTENNQKAFDSHQLILAESFGDYLAIAVENATNYQRVQDLTITDDLTKLYNSRYLPIVLERELSRARRYSEQLSVVFLDLDNFKQVNDKYGHLAGSQLLTEFGDFLYEQIRSSDIGIRYGGDEFVLVLPRTSTEEAVKVVQRMIKDLRGCLFLKTRGLQIGITASFGVSTFPTDGNNIDAMIAAADKAMYHVKHTTKNAVVAFAKVNPEQKSQEKKSQRSE